MLLPDWGGDGGCLGCVDVGLRSVSPIGGKALAGWVRVWWVGLLLAADSSQAAMPKHAQFRKQTCSRRVPADAQVVAASERERRAGGPAIAHLLRTRVCFTSEPVQ